MQRLLEKVPFGRSTVYAKLNDALDNRYADSTFPKPFYAPKCRFPLWWEDEVDAWLAAAEASFRDSGHIALPPKGKKLKEPGPAVATAKASHLMEDLKADDAPSTV